MSEHQLQEGPQFPAQAVASSSIGTAFGLIQQGCSHILICELQLLLYKLGYL